MAIDINLWRWQDAAACKGEDLVLFFGPDGERQRERDIRERRAKRICGGCTVSAECLDGALARFDKGGIFGGLTEDERRNEYRKRSRRTRTAVA